MNEVARSHSVAIKTLADSNDVKVIKNLDLRRITHCIAAMGDMVDIAVAIDNETGFEFAFKPLISPCAN